MEKKACMIKTADNNTFNVWELSDAANTARTHIIPINGRETTESHSRVRRFPNPSTWSFIVKAAFTDRNKIRRFTMDIITIGPTNHHITDSYTDNQQLKKMNIRLFS